MNPGAVSACIFLVEAKREVECRLLCTSLKFGADLRNSKTTALENGHCVNFTGLKKSTIKLRETHQSHQGVKSIIKRERTRIMPARNIYTNMLRSISLSPEKAKVWEHRVKHCVVYKEYRRRCQQTVKCLLSKDTSGKYVLLKNARAREYYMCPRWARDGGDNEPCQPEADATYYKWERHDDCTWSSNDDEGTLLGYDSDNAVVFCERKKTGQLVEMNQIVCPYQPDVMTYDGIPKAADDDGRILAWYDDVKKKYDPYKTKNMARDIERKRRPRHLLGTKLKKKVDGEFCCGV
jgi:hypothetical protein